MANRVGIALEDELLALYGELHCFLCLIHKAEFVEGKALVGRLSAELAPSSSGALSRVG